MKVVHCKKEKFDIYIGRTIYVFHYGNPWSHRPSDISIMVESKAVALDNFRKWITCQDFKEVEPLRRDWILRHLSDLKGKILGCWCSPAACHGDIYTELLNDF